MFALFDSSPHPDGSGPVLRQLWFVSLSARKQALLPVTCFAHRSIEDCPSVTYRPRRRMEPCKQPQIFFVLFLPVCIWEFSISWLIRRPRLAAALLYIKRKKKSRGWPVKAEPVLSSHRGAKIKGKPFGSDHDSFYSSKGQKNTEGMSEQQEPGSIAALQFCGRAT